MWFETLTGFREQSPQQVRANLALSGLTLMSKVNGKSYVCGILSIRSLRSLRDQVDSRGYSSGNISLHEVVADVRQLHRDPSNARALFQVASQFNLLEMASPNVTPEQGVGIYETDQTQGPACAIAAGAGTIFRNYFVDVNGRIGQSAGNQIDCLADLGKALGNEGNGLWEMRNGYSLAPLNGLVRISERLRAAGELEIDELRQRLQIGIQWNTQVTIGGCTHLVSQAYCSALPVGYSSQPQDLWAPFARLILEASYEATICAAILNSKQNNNKHVYLTLLGGGVFGNRTDWILAAIRRALDIYKTADLEVAIVSYGRSNHHVQQLVRELQPR